MRDLDKARWLQLNPLLDELLDLDTSARAIRLEQLRADDATLADDLQALLARDAELEQQAFLARPALPTLSTAPLLAGQSVGAYTLEREIGHGGMGSVWLARRTDGRFEGQVAIKFLSSGLLGHGDPGRFAREGQILGRLAHPNIARLLDAGIAPESQQPYLVLEYIDGQPIDRFCEERALGVEARVRLFLDVLAAVAHAHNRLILHRDLKPSNILVNAAGEVKLLDFGIAKLLGDGTQAGHGAAATELTQRAGNAYTLQYAAPEQVQGGEVTTATDVYALGVLLFLLLGGRHPILTGSESQVQRLRAVVETEARRLSETAPATRKRELRGDLDTIVARALKKAPAERYANAAAIADDLRRWLAHEPITARPDSAAYRIALFVRRHRLGVAAGTTVALALATGLGVAIWESREAQHQRDQAEGMVEFMLGDLRKKLEPVGRLEVMDAVGEKALAYYAQQPTGQQSPDSLGRRSRALHLLGEIAEKRGKLDEADRMFREAAESTAELLARAPHDGQRVFDHAQSVYWVGFVARRRGQLEEARKQFEQYLTLAKQLTLLAPANLDWRAEEAYANDNLGVLQSDAGDLAGALATFSRTRDVWAGLTRVQPSAWLELAVSWGWISSVHNDLGQYAEAIAAEQEKLKALAQVPDAQRSRRIQELRAVALHSIGRMAFWLGENETAESSESEAIRQYQELTDVDSANLDWLAQLSTARLGMAEVLSALDRQGELQTLTVALARDIDRLLSTDGTKMDWQVNLQGRLLQLLAQQARLETVKASAHLQSLRQYLAQVKALESQSKAFSNEQTRVIASAELLLGDLIASQPSPPAEAQVLWQSAALRLGALSQRRDMASMILLAVAKFRLGKTQEAQTLADIIRASSYRGPRYEELRKALQMPNPTSSQTAKGASWTPNSTPPVLHLSPSRSAT
ncbi:MAG: protein kinase [Burkholderiaceae bacterium]